MRKISRPFGFSVSFLLVPLATAIASRAQTFNNVFSFDNTDGNSANATLLQGADGDLYGTTAAGGAYRQGTVFKIGLDGALTTLHSFCPSPGCADGSFPASTLVQTSRGILYGTANGGGANGNGTVFSIMPTGALVTLYSFCSQPNCTDGAVPAVGLVLSGDENLYGITSEGGAVGGNSNGTVFKITPSGTLTTLYSFCLQSGCPDGAQPAAPLVEGTDGYFYGTTYYGGLNGGGTVFKISSRGALTTLYSFCSQSGCADGAQPHAGLVQGTDGNFYGTTLYGGADDSCVNGPFVGCGTFFKITPSGTLTTLHSFDGADGYDAGSALIQATDGNFYGTTLSGGNSNNCYLGCGTIFEATPSGDLTTLQSFDGADGQWAYGGLVQDTDGSFYGPTNTGGPKHFGTLYRLSVGLGPFVEMNPTSGRVGRAVVILGTKLTGATSVTFNGIPATFTVESARAIRTTVPAGATTGPVQVVTPSGVLSSNMAFRVVP